MANPLYGTLKLRLPEFRALEHHDLVVRLFANNSRAFLLGKWKAPSRPGANHAYADQSRIASPFQIGNDLCLLRHEIAN